MSFLVGLIVGWMARPVAGWGFAETAWKDFCDVVSRANRTERGRFSSDKRDFAGRMAEHGQAAAKMFS